MVKPRSCTTGLTSGFQPDNLQLMENDGKLATDMKGNHLQTDHVPFDFQIKQVSTTADFPEVWRANPPHNTGGNVQMRGQLKENHPLSKPPKTFPKTLSIPVIRVSFGKNMSSKTKGSVFGMI